MHGLMRKLVANMAQGVGKGFTRGARDQRRRLSGRSQRQCTVHLTLGYSHPIVYQLPPGVTAKVERQVTITLESADRQLLGIGRGATARTYGRPSRTRARESSTPTEKIRRKAGKAAAGSSAG